MMSRMDPTDPLLDQADKHMDSSFQVGKVDLDSWPSQHSVTLV